MTLVCLLGGIGEASRDIHFLGARLEESRTEGSRSPGRFWVRRRRSPCRIDAVCGRMGPFGRLDEVEPRPERADWLALGMRAEWKRAVAAQRRADRLHECGLSRRLALEPAP